MYIGLSDFSKKSVDTIIKNDDVDDLYTNRVIRIINNEFEIKLFLAEKLGSECFNYLTIPERNLIVKRLKTYSTDPANSISDVAGTFESFLRRL